MLRVVVAPDSFKGSLTAPAACAAIARGLARALPGVTVHARPMADGGEGTLDAVLTAVGGAARRETLAVSGAGGAIVEAAYGLLPHVDGRTAVIEVAQVVGITDATGMSTPVGARSTRGIGELVRALLDRDIRRFMIGLGGSSTNDGGSGMLVALGLRLLAADGQSIEPTPDGLAALTNVDSSALDPRLARCDFRIMSDVNNPLSGRMGATAIFGPQKGVEPAQSPRFDRSLAQFAALAEAAIGRSAAQCPGAGAAGGLGFALQLLGGTFASGAEVVAELVGLDEALADADWVLTGEGRSDAQTLLAKAPFVVARHAARLQVPATLLSGAVEADALTALNEHFAGCFALPNGPATLEGCVANAAMLLELRAEQVARAFHAGWGRAGTTRTAME
jgi:glycerate kinase